MPSGVYERTSEHNAANSKSKMGHEVSDKTRKKISTTKKDVPQSPETRAALLKANAGVPKSPETCAKISDTLTGVPHTPERIAAIKKGMENSEACKAEHERQRGGNDLVNHHWLYDHDDLSLNTVQMKRSDHSRLHRLLKKLGYIIPHINLPDEQGKEARDEVLL